MLWEFVDFKNQLITIPKSKHGDSRHVRMNSKVSAILSGLRKHNKGPGRVFTLHSPRCWFEPAVESAGLKDFTWHCLRHTFISRLVMAGADLRTVQELAGHKNIQMTCRYAHLAPGHEQTAIELLVRKSASPKRKRTAGPTATTTATGQIQGNYTESLAIQ
jgi:integrase